MKPGGRFVAECGGHTNVAAIVVAFTAVLSARGFKVPTPWYFPSPESYADRLSAHGFAVESIALIPRPTPLPTGISGWLETFGGAFLDDVPAKEWKEVLSEVEALLRPCLYDEASGRWTADYVRLRFKARVAAE